MKKYPKYLIMKANYKGKLIVITPNNYEKHKNILTRRNRKLFKEYFGKNYIPEWLKTK